MSVKKRKGKEKKKKINDEYKFSEQVKRRRKEKINLTR